MKKNILITALTFLIVVSGATSIQAGTFFAGAKYWDAKWDAAILDWFEEDIGISLQQNRLTLTSHKEDGDGYLAGPMFGYQSDDGKWSVSFAPMVISDFTQDWSGDAGPSMTLLTSVELDRKDFDLALSYTLNKYFKAYVGYKYQDMKMDFDLSYVTTMGQQDFFYVVESTVHMPTIGVGAVYPFHEKLVGGLQLGLLYTIPQMEISEPSIGSEDLKPWPDFGFNGEATLTYRPFRDWLFQAGYRYQVFRMEALGFRKRVIIDSYDVTHGWTLSAVYLF